MERVVLVVNAHHDVPTSYLTAWIHVLIEKTASSSLRIIQLEASTANRNNFESVVSKENPSLIILNGHGTEESVFGFEYNILVSVADNVGYLSGRNTHALACQAAKSLGPHSISIGAKSFIGYREDFQFCHKNKTSPSDILNDDYAQPTLSPAFKAIEALLEGKSAEEAFALSQMTYAESLLSLITNPDPDFNTTIAACTSHNRIYQTLLGGNLPTQAAMPSDL